MTDEPRQRSEEHDHEHKLEKKLARAHAEAEKLERELAEVEQLEGSLERELEEERLRHDEHRFFLVFIINGEDFPVKTQPDAPLKQAVEKALIESGNTGRRDASEWEVRDSAGVLLEMARIIEDLGIKEGDRLFLSLKVGAGGNDALRS